MVTFSFEIVDIIFLIVVIIWWSWVVFYFACMPCLPHSFIRSFFIHFNIFATVIKYQKSSVFFVISMVMLALHVHLQSSPRNLSFFLGRCAHDERQKRMIFILSAKNDMYIKNLFAITHKSCPLVFLEDTWCLLMNVCEPHRNHKFSVMPKAKYCVFPSRRQWLVVRSDGGDVNYCGEWQTHKSTKICVHMKFEASLRL